MLFYSIFNTSGTFSHWENIIAQHAKWLQQIPFFYKFKHNTGLRASVVWFSRNALDINKYIGKENNSIFFSTTRPIPDDFRFHTLEDNEQWLLRLIKKIINPVINIRDDSIYIGVPLTSPEKIYYSISNKTVVISNDLRFLGFWSDANLSLSGLYELLHFRCSPLSGTIFEGVHRVPNGQIIKIDESLSFKRIVLVQINEDKLLEDNIPVEDQVKKCIAGHIHSCPDHTGLLFSGGVDSGLLAALAAEQQRKDIVLINYSFSENDPQAHLAKQVANHLKMNLQQIMHTPEVDIQALDRIIQSYSHPFGDHAFLPSEIMCRWISTHLPNLTHILDGDGADTLFALPLMFFNRKKYYTQPEFKKQFFAYLYRSLSLWKYHKQHHILGRLEDFVLPYYLSLQFPADLSWMFPKKSLNGLAYFYPSQDYFKILSDLRTFYISLAQGLPDEELYGLSALVQNCCGISTAKTYDPLQTQGLVPEFPFLNYDMLTLSYAMDYRQKNVGGEAKSVLKTMLNRYLPGNLIYRPKKGFIPPSKNLLSMAFVRERVHDIVYQSTNDLWPLCNQKIIRRAFSRVHNGQPVSKAMFGFLWLLLFSSLWIYQYKERRTEIREIKE